MVHEPAHEPEQLRGRLRDDPHPAQRQQELRAAGNHDRDAEDGAYALREHPLERLAGHGRAGVAEEGRLELLERALHAGVLARLDDVPGRSALVGRVAPDDLEPAVADLPQLGNVGVEHLSGLGADRGDDRAPRRVDEARNEPGDAFERRRGRLARARRRATVRAPARPSPRRCARARGRSRQRRVRG